MLCDIESKIVCIHFLTGSLWRFRTQKLSHNNYCIFFQTCKVRAFALRDQPSTTAFEIKFEDSVIARDKMLESVK